VGRMNWFSSLIPKRSFLLSHVLQGEGEKVAHERDYLDFLAFRNTFGTFGYTFRRGEWETKAAHSPCSFP